MILRSDRSNVVIAHDYLTQRGGAERVVLAMCGAFPDAPVVTSVFDQSGTFGEFSERNVLTTPLQKLPILARHHRLGLPFYASAFSRVQVDAPIVICSTSGWAHGVRTTGVKALYVHNTARWVYQADEYLRGRYSGARGLAMPLSGSLRRWNYSAASEADKVWVNSRAVQERVWRNWSLESEVLYPPHGVNPAAPQEEVDGIPPGYLLTVNRLLHHKRVDVLIEAMRELPDHRLVVVGDGPESRRLRSIAPANCRILGRISDAKLRWLYANCLGLVSAAHEDLGLAPLEAMAFGRPVAVLRRGGFLETVVEGETGVFFDDQDPALAAKAIRELVAAEWRTAEIAAWADRFSAGTFTARLRAGVEELVGDSALPSAAATKGLALA